MALPPKSDRQDTSSEEALGIEAFQAFDRIREALSGQLTGAFRPVH